MTSRLNVVQICDHPGWPGSRMHGVKRLFARMIPRFDAARFRVRLVSLRAPDTSGDRLEDHGIDVTYLSRPKFDPRTSVSSLKLMVEYGISQRRSHATRPTGRFR